MNVCYVSSIAVTVGKFLSNHDKSQFKSHKSFALYDRACVTDMIVKAFHFTMNKSVKDFMQFQAKITQIHLISVKV